MVYAERLVCYPVSLKPALSVRHLKRGILKPATSHDRVYLTDVGGALLRYLKKHGGKFKLIETNGYLPGRVIFIFGRVSGQVLYRRFGMSSYHTVIEITLHGERKEIERFREEYLKDLGRSPKESPFIGLLSYWNAPGENRTDNG